MIRPFVPIRLSACGGLTLIELIITLSIIVLLLGAGIPAYRHYSYVNDLAQAAQDVKNAILETQSFALAPEADKNPIVSISGADYPADSYLVNFPLNGTEYSIYLASSVKPGEYPTNPIKSYFLPRGISFSNGEVIQYSIENQAKISYFTPSTIDGDETSIILISNKLTDQKTIEVNKETGQISIQ